MRIVKHIRGTRSTHQNVEFVAEVLLERSENRVDILFLGQIGRHSAYFALNSAVISVADSVRTSL